MNPEAPVTAAIGCFVVGVVLVVDDAGGFEGLEAVLILCRFLLGITFAFYCWRLVCKYLKNAVPETLNMAASQHKI